MALNTDAAGKTWDPATFTVEAERIARYAEAIGAESPLHRDPEAARAAGFRDVVAPPMFCVVYSGPALGPAILDPEVEMNLAAMVHGGQVFEWGEPVCAGDEITTTRALHVDRGARRQGVLRLRVGLRQPGRRRDGARYVDGHRARVSDDDRSSRSATRCPNCA